MKCTIQFIVRLNLFLKVSYDAMLPYYICYLLCWQFLLSLTNDIIFACNLESKEGKGLPMKGKEVNQMKKSLNCQYQHEKSVH